MLTGASGIIVRLVLREVEMKAYRVKKKIAANGELKLNALPFQEGDEVEVIILSRKTGSDPVTSSPLRGKVIEYLDPTEPVAIEDWELLK